ncbi:MAG: terminase [Patescibacteria group bacterium]|nr:terminase [Patescibacteria group bacterium]
MTTDTRVVWAPQSGPQKTLIDCPFMEVLFGGARGGGKTDGVLGKYAIKEGRFGSGFNAIFFRKEMPQTDDLVERAKEIYLPLGAEWREQPRMFRMPNGGRVRFRPLENVNDAQKYQGQSLTDVAVEEAGNYEDPAPIDMLFGALRSKAGVPVQMILTANPGGAGHAWIRHRFIDPAPLGNTPLVRRLPNGASHQYVYIPSRVKDNQILLSADPDYVNRLHLVGSPELVKAWLDGDWNVVAGAFFPEFSIERHVVAPRELPMYWHRFRSFDWGSARPFCVGWYAVSDGELPTIPRGALVKYREWYGAKQDVSGNTVPNVGLRLTAEEIAHGIKERERGDLTGNKQMGGVADPSIFAEDGGPSHADRMAARGVYFRAADNTRVPKLGAMGGWDQLRSRLKGDGERPAIYFFSTCRDTIRTLPALQHDPGRIEDVDSDGEDHAGDETRYACLSRPYVAPLPEADRPTRDGYARRRRMNRRVERGTGWAA